MSFSAGDCRILRQMSMAINQPRENCDWPAIDPLNRRRPLGPPNVIVIPDLRDAPLVNNNGSIAIGADRAYFRGID